MSYLHSVNVVHGDLKPENILTCESGTSGIPLIKLVDFGHAIQINRGTMVRRSRGTFPFAAPEIERGTGKPYDPFPNDVWALGVILLECSHGLYCLNNAVEQSYRRLGLPIKQDVRVLHRFDRDPISLMMDCGNPHPSTNIATTSTIIRGCLMVDTKWRWTMARLETAPWVISGIKQIRTKRIHVPSRLSSDGGRLPKVSSNMADHAIPSYFQKIHDDFIPIRHESADPGIDFALNKHDDEDSNENVEQRENNDDGAPNDGSHVHHNVIGEAAQVSYANMGFATAAMKTYISCLDGDNKSSHPTAPFIRKLEEDKIKIRGS